MIQIDGSDHHWFEHRGPRCTLLVYIDDATSRLVELRFTASESTLDYFHSTHRYLETYGKPIAFYSDKHTVFRVNKQEAKTGTGLTQFGRALHGHHIYWKTTHFRNLSKESESKYSIIQMDE